MPRMTLWTAAVIAAVALTPPQAWGSSQARVSGTVTTTAGEPIPNVSVIVTSPDLPSFRKELKTDADGHYDILLLDATKTYRYTAQADGFAPFEVIKKVPAGSTDNEIDFTLKTVQEALANQEQDLPGYKELKQGVDLARQGQLEQARASLMTAVELLPDAVRAWSTLCEVEYQLADYEAALDHAKRCLELDDEQIRCLAVAANSSHNLGKTDEHAIYIQRYQELNPDDPATVFNQAVTYLNALDDEKARPLLEKCLEIDPDFPKCLYEYGMMLLRSGDLEGAKRHLERYLEVAPDGEDAATAAETIKYL